MSFRTWALALTLACWAGPIFAHDPGDSRLRLQRDGPVLQATWELHPRDLDQVLDLDADGDGLLRWGELTPRWAEVEALARRSLQLGDLQGRPCTAGVARPPALRDADEGRRIVWQGVWTCPEGGAAGLRLAYRFMAGLDPQHRGLLAWEDAGGGHGSAVLDPTGPAWRLDPGAGALAQAGFLGFLGQGVVHLLVGADHLLFLLALLMVSVLSWDGRAWQPREHAGEALRELVSLATLFTLAHSLTLAMAATGVWSPPARAVEVAIALSVGAAALHTLRPVFQRARHGLVLAVGLVHGFGFAGVLQDLGLPPSGRLLPLLGFNLGVELGQLAALAVALPLLWALRRQPAYRQGALPTVAWATTTLAAAWAVQRAFG